MLSGTKINLKIIVTFRAKREMEIEIDFVYYYQKADTLS